MYCTCHRKAFLCHLISEGHQLVLTASCHCPLGKRSRLFLVIFGNRHFLMLCIMTGSINYLVPLSVLALPPFFLMGISREMTLDFLSTDECIAE